MTEENRGVAAKQALDQDDYKGVFSALGGDTKEGVVAALATIDFLMRLTPQETEKLQLRWKLMLVQHEFESQNEDDLNE